MEEREIWYNRLDAAFYIGSGSDSAAGASSFHMPRDLMLIIASYVMRFRTFPPLPLCTSGISLSYRAHCPCLTLLWVGGCLWVSAHCFDPITSSQSITLSSDGRTATANTP